MNTITAALAAALSVVAASSCAKQTAPETAKEDARAVAFRDDCARSLSNLEATEENIKKAGWTVTESTAHKSLSQVMKLAEKMAPELMNRASAQYFRREIAGQEVYLVLSHTPTDEGWANGCYLYDFDASDIDRSPTIESWLGVSPTETQNYPSQFAQLKWIGPASQPKLASVRVSYISQAAASAANSPFYGAAWAATAFAEDAPSN